MSKVIAVVNQKGGMGKTTTCFSLGVGLARKGKKVLLVDGDPQASLTVCIGHPNTDDLEIPDDTDISENLVNTESVRKLQTAVKTLPLLHQEIIILKFEDEQTNVQIADSLGMNASTVGTILNRSMKKLRKILEEYYHD